MAKRGHLHVALVMLAAAACDDPPPPPPPPPAASAAPPASGSAQLATSPEPTPPRELTPLTADAIAALDVVKACVAICEAQVFCTVDEEVLANEKVLARRYQRCGRSCVRNRPPKEVSEEYLERARRCLAATDCAVFSDCAFGAGSVARAKAAASAQAASTAQAASSAQASASTQPSGSAPAGPAPTGAP